MADLALGAVHSLLRLIRDETALLGRVQGDVQFIKDEMESMNSFLLHLARTTPPSGEHDEQVRTWMKQVRDLANDCTNCIDLYVQRRDPELQRARGFMGYVLWLPWFLRALVAQHRAAIQLQELKIRAHDVGERRMRYGVKVPKGQVSDGEVGLAASPAGFMAGEEHRWPHLVKNPYLGSALAFSEPVLEECTKVLLRWLANTDTVEEEEGQCPRVIAVAVPDTEVACNMAQQVCHRLPCSLPPSLQFEHQAWLTLPNTQDATFLPTIWHLLTTFLGELLHPGRPIRDHEIAAWDTMGEEDLASMIAEHLQVKGKRSLIILVGFDHEHLWEKMSHALSAFDCAAGSAVIVTTNYESVANELMKSYQEKPLVYSRVDFFYQRALEVVYGPSHNITDYYFEEKGRPLREILYDIFSNCEPHVFCMKLFFHSLYANPDKSIQELERLCNILDPQDSLETKANKMLLFCYNSMPKDSKSCLMYLAIFGQQQEIGRSRLVERWVAEGLVTGEDWPSSVHQAERCFDTLVDRWFIAPTSGRIGTTGKVKACALHHILVYMFVREMARKERFVNSRLSHHLAWHFSIHNGLWLRRSDTIQRFLGTMPPSSQLHLVKVLDLKGCEDLEKNKHKYLKNICNKMLLLKYLSLRQTDITLLPAEINKLQQLEVLDIRETRVDRYATRDILLPKLKRLLAGGSSNGPEGPFTHAVKTPLRIDKMQFMEVLSHVEFSSSRDASNVKTIARLWLLKKLGVVIYNKQSHVTSMLGAISDMNECLESLSVRIKCDQGAENKEAPDYTSSIPDNIRNIFKKPPKYLKSLSINGISGTGLLLPLLLKDSDQLAKVTLSNTFMNQNDVETFLAKVSKLRCLRLRVKSYIGTMLCLKNGDFQNLEYLLVEDPDITSISFGVGAAPKLEKIVWSCTSMESLPGINNLPVLKELEFISCNIPDQVREAIAAHPNYPVLKLN